MRISSKIRRFFSRNIIEKNPTIIKEMQRYNAIYGRIDKFTSRVVYLIKLYVCYAIGRKNPVKLRYKKNTHLKFPESEVEGQVSRDEFLYLIQTKEIVVFEVFNVMLYELLSERQLISLYETTSGNLGISAWIDECEKWVDTQEYYELKKSLTIDDPYIHELWNLAKANEKEVYIINNSSYEDEYVIKLLKEKGYEASLYTGGEACYVREKQGEKNSVTYYNVNAIGEKYRPFHYLNTVTSIYNQIVNMRLHSGMDEKSLFYEYGYTCGGILTCGFCQFLNDLVDREQIDKIVFVARDGDIIKKVYDKYFHKCETAYLVYSRFASYELIFRDFPEEYIDKNIKVRIDRPNSNNSIENVLTECGLESMANIFESKGMCLSDNLDMENYKLLREILLENQREVACIFDESVSAAKTYFLEQIGDARKVCIVDLGWNGKSITYIKHLLKQYGWDGTVIGAMIGASGGEVTQNYISSKVIYPYAFANDFWRRMGTNNGEVMTEKEVICIEALYSSQEKTLLRYCFDKNGRPAFIWGKENQNVNIINEIQQGIIDFANEFMQIIDKLQLVIQPREAYTPLDCVMQNRKFVNQIFEAYKEEPKAINGFDKVQKEK